MVKWLEQLSYGGERHHQAIKREFEAGLRHATTGKLFLSSQQ